MNADRFKYKEKISVIISVDQWLSSYKNYKEIINI